MMGRPRRTLLVLVFILLFSSAAVYAAPADMNLKIDGVGTVSAPLQIVLLLTLLSFVPAALVIMTSFTRIAIVFHFLRQALGTQEMPSNQILIGLALFLTVFVMAPTGDRVYELAVQPAMAGDQQAGTAHAPDQERDIGRGDAVAKADHHAGRQRLKGVFGGGVEHGEGRHRGNHQRDARHGVDRLVRISFVGHMCGEEMFLTP